MSREEIPKEHATGTEVLTIDGRQGTVIGSAKYDIPLH